MVKAPASALDRHPTVLAHRAKELAADQHPTADDIRRWLLEAGADDVGFVSIDRPEIADQRDEILEAFPATRTLVSFVVRMNRVPVISPNRSVSNLEFHATGEQVNDVARRMVRKFEEIGVGALNPSMGFPMEVSRFPGKIWIVSHKPVAVAAGLGQMGIHRNVIHPKFGNFILLGTVLIDIAVDQESQPIEYNPCLECKLCVAACPVGAISPDGSFNFASCFTHNYREFMSGFTDWVETVVESGSASEYRSQYSDAESASMWQSLSIGPNYKAAYCLSACPAGEDVIGPFLSDRGEFVKATVKPLQQKQETVYVIPNSDAEVHVRKRFPHKTVKQVGSVLRPSSIDGFIHAMHHVFQPGKSEGLDARYHFRFTGKEPADCTVQIRDRQIEVHDGHVGVADLRVTADSTAWLRFLRKEVGIAWLLLTLRIRLRGNPKWLVVFGKCFP
jgi:NAD-dependent dihydropyrimidine dehydrogenase PreA subunit